MFIWFLVVFINDVVLILNIKIGVFEGEVLIIVEKYVYIVVVFVSVVDKCGND